jgi:hypothetical protein
MDMEPDVARELLLEPVACDRCVEKNQVDNVGFGKKAIENAPFCPQCAQLIVSRIAEHIGTGPLGNLPGIR